MHFILTDQRLKIPEKKMPLHQNPSLSHIIIIIKRKQTIDDVMSMARISICKEHYFLGALKTMHFKYI